MTRKRLVRQLLSIHLAIVCARIVAAGWFAMNGSRRRTPAKFDRLAATARLIADKAAPGFTGAPDALEASAAEVGREMSVRITLVQTDGKVIFDTDDDAASAGQSCCAPEIVTALAGDEGRSNRYSVSLARRMLYDYGSAARRTHRGVVRRPGHACRPGRFSIWSGALGILGVGLLIFLLATLAG